MEKIFRAAAMGTFILAGCTEDQATNCVGIAVRNFEKEDQKNPMQEHQVFVPCTGTEFMAVVGLIIKNYPELLVGTRGKRTEGGMLISIRQLRERRSADSK